MAALFVPRLFHFTCNRKTALEWNKAFPYLVERHNSYEKTNFVAVKVLKPQIGSIKIRVKELLEQLSGSHICIVFD